MFRDLAFTAIVERKFNCPNLAALHGTLREADHDWREAKAMRVEYDNLSRLCEIYIKASYAYQKARWGRIQFRMTSVQLMR